MNLEIISWAFEFSHTISKDASETIKNAENILNIILDIERQCRTMTMDDLCNLLGMICDDEMPTAMQTGHHQKENDEKPEEYRCDIRP